MQISPVSNFHGIAAIPGSPPPAPKSTSASTPEDTVHLSAAALVQLKTGDADHDGDSH